MAAVKKSAISFNSAPAPTVKEKSAKATKANKPSMPKKARAHPSYLEMIKEYGTKKRPIRAVTAVTRGRVSSQIAIAKFIEEKHKAHLPLNFKKLLLVQLKKLVASGKLVKVKNSFKLAVTAKLPSSAVATITIAAKKLEAAAKKNVTAVAKPKRKTIAVELKKAAKMEMVKSPVKKKVPSKAAKNPKSIKSPVKKKVPLMAAKKPKSIKSPAKKATPAKKGKK
ncbi:winged-helix DNA-binding transcription factor family protein [Actinidia rufa]|uniref:Winged-helix DNA-binding transcription factor family protein n=1 Tax=Actinidia rufa TaxID=165716 RepID=A0A7J0GDC4_9ERIC|nr:winged-helix DNA-binding transcription factor family protein [Actinidia rufa]